MRMRRIKSLRKKQNIQDSGSVQATPIQNPLGHEAYLQPLSQTPTQSQNANLTSSQVSIQQVAEPSPVTGALTPSVSVSQIDEDKELFRVKSFWMLDLFPNELIIRQKTLHVILRDFLSSNIETMMLDDISVVQVNNGIFFSSLVIRYRNPHEDLQISKIPKAQAMKAKAVLDSHMVNKKTNKNEDIETISSAA